MSSKLGRKTYQHSVDGKQIVVFDDVLSAADQVTLHESAATSQYYRQGATERAETVVRYWVSPLTPTYGRKTFYHHVALAHIRTCVPRITPRLHQVYINSHGSGEMVYPHVDSVTPEMVTVLLYANREWDTRWGGETVFYNDQSDAVACVTPRPGRMVLMNGSLMHRATPPLRGCSEDRLVLVFKYLYPEGSRPLIDG